MEASTNDTNVSPRERVFWGVDHGRNKDKGDGRKPHALTVQGQEPIFVDDKDIGKLVKAATKPGKLVTIFTEQSNPRAFMEMLMELGIDVRPISQFDVHEKYMELGIDAEDDLAVSGVILELGLDTFRVSGGERPAVYMPVPDWFEELHACDRNLRDIIKFSTAVQNRSHLQPNDTLLESMEKLKEQIRRRLIARASKSDVGLGELFKDIRGFGVPAASFFAGMQPFNWRSEGGFVSKSGFTEKAKKSKRYNHEVQGVLHNVVDGIIKAQDPVYYPFYISWKEKFIADHEHLGPHKKCKLVKGGPCHKADGKARNRLKTELVREVYRRMGPDSDWYKAHNT